ncbi:MAG: hypothetical protein KIH62_003485 [Candidatus Kerfeldbacteria bacterium]|nr:hypothetical protein [Candidatus Kerfeldbacteria bacterium]
MPLILSYEIDSDGVSALLAPAKLVLRQAVSTLNTVPHPSNLFYAQTPAGDLLRQYITRPIASIYTHTNEVPFSGGAVALMLRELDVTRTGMYILGRPSGITDAIVLCPETERFDNDTASENFERWDEAVDQRMSKVVGDQWTAERASIFTRVNEAMLRSLAKKYQFGWYRSSAQASSVLRRVA